MVTLNAQALAVTSFSSESGTATLPAAFAPGTYLLSMQTEGREKRHAEFDVGLGASGQLLGFVVGLIRPVNSGGTENNVLTALGVGAIH
jgi:hypothetical protein